MLSFENDYSEGCHESILKAFSETNLVQQVGYGEDEFSLRAKEPNRVDDIAGRFGGGGHPQASGITMGGTLDECVETVLKAMEEKTNA